MPSSSAVRLSNGSERAASSIRNHSCAWQAVSDSHAKSSGSSSRPSGSGQAITEEIEPVRGPVRSIRWCGSNSIMPRSHPFSGSEGTGKSRAIGQLMDGAPAIAAGPGVMLPGGS